MSRQPLKILVCPCCGFDVARVLPAADGFRVICTPELGGCGAESNKAPDEAGAVVEWNRCPSPGARALSLAARLRHAEGRL